MPTAHAHSQSAPPIPPGPFGVPLEVEPDTGYVTRGLSTYAVDYADMTVKKALDLGVTDLGVQYVVVSDGKIRVWSAALPGGALSYAATKEAAIRGALPRPRVMVGVDPGVGADKTGVVVSVTGPTEPPPRPAAEKQRGVFSFDVILPPARGPQFLSLAKLMLAKEPSLRILYPRHAEALGIGFGWKHLYRELSRTQGPHARVAADILDALGAQSSIGSVVVEGGAPDKLVPRLCSMWAMEHPRGRIFISGDHARLCQFFGAPPPGSPHSWRSLEGVTLPTGVSIRGHVLHAGTPTEYIAGTPTNEDTLWITLDTPTPAQMDTLLGHLQASLILFGTEEERVKSWGSAWRADPRFFPRVTGEIKVETAPKPIPDEPAPTKGIRGEREAMVKRIFKTLKKNTKITAPEGNDPLYADLAVAWADEHPAGVVVIAGTRKTLTRIFAGKSWRGEDALDATGRCDTTSCNTTSRGGDPNYFVAQVTPQRTPIHGFRLRSATPPERIAVLGPSGDPRVLWIVTHPVTPEQLEVLAGLATHGAHVVLFGSPDPELHGYPDPDTWVHVE